MDIAENDEEAELSPAERLKATHRKEKKDLLAKITSLKHAVPKSDKKKKREVLAEAEKLERELKERQEKELSELEASVKPSEADPVICNEDENGSGPVVPEIDRQPRVSKAAKRREKKAEMHKRMNEAAEEDEEASKFAPRNLEAEAIKASLSSRNLRLYDIPPDGDCLYNAVAHQLSSSVGGAPQLNGKDVRRKAAAYIRANKEDFLPFLTWNDGSPIDEFEFEKYCGQVERSCDEGGQWGGEAELRALSNVFEKRIEVLQPEGRVAVFGEQYASTKPLIITYHRHAYSLGEHYNSTATNTSLI